MEAATQELTGPPPTGVEDGLRGPPPPLHGGPITLLRFMRRHRMLTPKYARLLVRLARRKLFAPRLELDGLAFIGPRVVLQIGRQARIELGRWSWLGPGPKIRCHEGVVSIGAKTGPGQEGTISPSPHASLGPQRRVPHRAMPLRPPPPPVQPRR